MSCRGLFSCVLLWLIALNVMAQHDSHHQHHHYEPRNRTYYISAVEEDWDYAPSGQNMMKDIPLEDDPIASVYTVPGVDRVGRVYKKALYRGFTDATFTQPIPHPPYLGMLGPIIRAVVGDTITVVFRNMASFPYSIHPHGVLYSKAAEGVPHGVAIDGAPPTGDTVQPGGNWTYVWSVPKRAGPANSDLSSMIWPYHSHVDEIADTNAGLIGAIIITSDERDVDDEAARPRDVQNEYVVLFSVINENESPYLNESLTLRSSNISWDELTADDDFIESNLMHSVNGYVYANLPQLQVLRGVTSRWHLMSMGTEVDLHTPHWHGNTVTTDGHRIDVGWLLPATTLTADMIPDNPGQWMFHCHVNDHIRAGMVAMYEVA